MPGKTQSLLSAKQVLIEHYFLFVLKKNICEEQVFVTGTQTRPYVINAT